MKQTNSMVNAMSLRKFMQWVIRGDERRRADEAFVSRVDAMTLSDAERVAIQFLEDPKRFRCLRSRHSETPLANIPGTVLQLFEKYETMETVTNTLRLAKDLVGSSSLAPSLTRIGMSSLGGERSEICVLGSNERVYDVTETAPSDNYDDSSFTSVYHLIVYYAREF